MPRQPSAGSDDAVSDRQYYARLWGTDGWAGQRQRRWLAMQRRSASLALLATLALLGYLALAPSIGSVERPELVTDGELRPNPDPALGPVATDPANGQSHGQGQQSGASSTPHPSVEGPTVTAGAPAGPDIGPASSASDAEGGAGEADGGIETAVSPAGPTGPTTPVVPVLFDTNASGDIDDTLALAMLHNYEATGMIDLLAITISYQHPQVASYVDAINTYYQAPDTPIAAITSGVAQGAESFHPQIVGAADRFPFDLPPGAPTEDPVTLLRRQLAAQPDGTVVMIATGYATNLARLLDSGPDAASNLSGRELVATKVRLLSTMGGEFGSSQVELNVFRDPDSARALYDRWPTAIITSPWQVGVDLPFPGEALLTMPDDRDNPVLEAYRLHGVNALGVGFPYHHPSFDLTAVLAAIELDAGYFDLSEPGVVSVDARAVTQFSPGGHGRHQLVQRPGPADAARIVDRLVELVTTMPGGDGSG